MAYPTTLALITALWSGPGAHEVDRAVVGARRRDRRRSGRCVAGALLEHFDWGSVFLVTLPLAVVALLHGLALVPAHVNETTEPVDNLGGILSVVLVAALVLAINFAPVPEQGRRWRSGSASVAVAALVAFVHPPAARARTRSTTSTSPRGASSGSRRCAGIIVFGSLMGAMFIGQQFLQNVLGYSTLDAGAGDPARGVLHGARRAALGQARRDARRALHAADRLRLLLLGFLTMLLLWERGHRLLEGRARLRASSASASGFAGTPASHSLTGSVPVRRAGMASGTADLQRDLGGAIMQSIFGALLTAGYAAAVGRGDRRRARTARQVTESVAGRSSTKSFAERGRASPQQYPQYATQIIAAAKASFLEGDQWAYTAGIVAVLLGAALVFFLFPKQDDEQRLLARVRGRGSGRDRVAARRHRVRC